MGNFSLSLLLTIVCSLVLVYAPRGVSSEENGQQEFCDIGCQDYNYQCNPLLQSTKTVDCNDNFFKQRCPMTCNQCRKCDQSSVNEDQDKQLEEFSGKLTTVNGDIGGINTILKQLDSRESFQLPRKSTQHGSVFQNTGSNLLIDDDLDTDYDKNKRCFHSNGINWVSVHLDNTYRIKTVQILNRDACEDRIIGATLKLCTSTEMTEDSCKVFGTVETGPKGGWITVNSQIEGILPNFGNTIRIEDADTINICEVRVVGY